MRGALVGIGILTGVAASSAIAAPATPDEAQRLTGLFERYVGGPAAGKSSAVTVVPHGEAYTATLDITRMLGFTAAMGLDVTAGDLIAELAPQPDGRWHVTVDGFPPIGITQGDQAFSTTIANYRFDGIFDPHIQAFATTTTTTQGSSSHARGKQDPVDVTLTDAGTGTTTAADAGSGIVNVTGTATYKDVDYRVTSTPSVAAGGADHPPVTVAQLRAAALDATTTIEHEPVIAIDDLWQFLVAHPTKASLVQAQADLKTRLRAIVPVAAAASGSLTLSKVAVDSSLGVFGLDSLTERYAANGAEAKGSNAVTLQYGGLLLPEGLVPGWAAPLVPTSLDLTQSYGPVNVTSALTTLIDAFDLSADKPLTDAQQGAVIEALGPDDMVLKVSPSTLSTSLMTLKFEGEARLKKPMPTGSATVTATGLDKTIEAVRSAAPTDPSGAQAVVLLMAAKALGKAEGPDSYSWQIATAPGGDVTINGASMNTTAQPQQANPNPNPKGRKKKLAP